VEPNNACGMRMSPSRAHQRQRRARGAAMIGERLSGGRNFLCSLSTPRGRARSGRRARRSSGGRRP
jgi:hypothetical protein